ncbi:MAG: hypothetical protein KF773_30685 [Deltaproteobacteria bacterium]|nr:hypothetical protein [Deltaproteobacteria bacterium]MCW5807141.1 hypothetical protein [Deltaproteobacteria bacterium]
MTRLEELIVGFAEGIPAAAGGPEAGVRVEITSIDLAVPIETHVDGAGLVRASLPRGRLATGYDLVHSQLVLRFEREEAA